MSSRYWTRHFIPATDGRKNNHPLPFGDHILIPQGTDTTDPNAPCYTVQVTTHQIREIHHFRHPLTMAQINTILRHPSNNPFARTQAFLALLVVRCNPGHFTGQPADYVCFMVMQHAKDFYRAARTALIAAERDVRGKGVGGVSTEDLSVLERAQVRHDHFLNHIAMVRLVVRCVRMEIDMAQEIEAFKVRERKRKRPGWTMD